MVDLLASADLFGLGDLLAELLGSVVLLGLVVCSADLLGLGDSLAELDEDLVLEAERAARQGGAVPIDS